jgi:hypothetical protein
MNEARNEMQRKVETIQRHKEEARKLQTPNTLYGVPASSYTPTPTSKYGGYGQGRVVIILALYTYIISFHRFYLFCFVGMCLCFFILLCLYDRVYLHSSILFPFFKNGINI